MLGIRYGPSRGCDSLGRAVSPWELRTEGGLPSEIGPPARRFQVDFFLLMASVALLRIVNQSYRSSKLFANAAYKTCDARSNGVTGRGLPPSDTGHSHNIDLRRLEVAIATEDLAYLPCLPFYYH